MKLSPTACRTVPQTLLTAKFFPQLFPPGKNIGVMLLRSNLVGIHELLLAEVLYWSSRQQELSLKNRAMLITLDKIRIKIRTMLETSVFKARTLTLSPLEAMQLYAYFDPREENEPMYMVYDYDPAHPIRLLLNTIDEKWI